MACQRRSWRLLVPIGAGVVVTTIGLGLFLTSRPSVPLDVVHDWVAARNDGDVDRAMALLAGEGEILGFGVHLPDHRERLRAALEAQVVAGWRMDESDCEATGETVTCRYRQDDAILRKWGLHLAGEHRYVIRDGRIGQLRRIHDPASRTAVYDEAEQFRQWVRGTHPELLDVIWSDPTSALYSTPEGAEAVLGILAEYVP